jgi:uncharacterized protein YnzC (UPF0291/DUF896 family)
LGYVGQAMSLDDVTQRLGRSHKKWKEAEQQKNKLRDEFFAAVNEELANELAAQSIVDVEGQDEEEVLRIAQRRFQKHRVVDVRQESATTWKVVLEENPEYRDFQYINPEDGQVYSRIVAEGAPFLDDDAIREENPELWDKITHEVTTREMKPVESLEPEVLAQLRPYLTSPKPSIRLGNPRRAKQEELDGEDYY